MRIWIVCNSNLHSYSKQDILKQWINYGNIKYWICFEQNAMPRKYIDVLLNFKWWIIEMTCLICLYVDVVERLIIFGHLKWFSKKNVCSQLVVAENRLPGMSELFLMINSNVSVKLRWYSVDCRPTGSSYHKKSSKSTCPGSRTAAETASHLNKFSLQR